MRTCGYSICQRDWENFQGKKGVPYLRTCSANKYQSLSESKMENSFYLKFEKATLPYLPAWDDWIVSDFCFLSEEEALLISSYLRLKTVRSLSRKIKRSEQTIIRKIHAVYRKLYLGTSIYQDWEKNRTEDDRYPLNIPIICLNAPVKLKHLLNQLGNTLGEILREYTEEELLKLRGWGAGMITDLRRILDLYGHADLLRPGTDIN